MNDVATATDPLADYLAAAALAVAATECQMLGKLCPLPDGVRRAIELMTRMRARDASCWLIGNGGSGTIADHIACDMVLKGWRAHALTNPALTTTMANDFGQDYGFARQIEALARPGDVLIAMSCSGESSNILMALANAPPVHRIALTGFRSANSLRMSFDAELGFWTPSETYAVVQIAHLTLLHAVIDLAGANG